MVEYSVSLDIKTKQCRLDDLIKLIGIDYDTEYSNDKNKENSEGTTYWRVFSNLSEDATLEEHINQLTQQMSQSKALDPAFRSDLLPSDCEFFLSVGVFFNEESEGSLAELPVYILKAINQYKLWLEMCLYPTNFD